MRGVAALLLFVACAAPLAAAEIPLQAFARHEQYRAVRISPDGNYLAATAVVNGHTVLSLIHLADMKGVNVTPRVNGDVIDFEWVDDTRVMYTIGIPYGGLELPVSTGDVYVVNADGSDVRVAYGGTQLPIVLQKDRANVMLVKNTLVGTKMGFYSEVCKLQLSNHVSDCRGKLPLPGASVLLDHEDHVRSVFGTDLDQSEKVFYRASDAEPWERLFGDKEAPPRPLLFSRDNSSVYFDCGGLCRWSVTARKMEQIWKGNGTEIDRLLRSFDGMDAVALRTEPGRPALTLLDKNAPEVKLLADLMRQFPGEDVQFTSNSRDGKRAVLLVASDTDPGQFYLYDADTKKISPLLARRPWIKPEQLASVEPVEFAARDGLGLHGYLTKPPGDVDAKNLPLVVYVHGGPYFVRDRWEYDPTVQALASRGFAVLQVNFRGSGGYSDQFVRAGFKEWGGKMQDDVTDATRWAIAQKLADPKRICIYGASYGGYAALEGAVKEPDLYKCAVGYVGVYDLRLMYRRGDIPQTAYGENYLKMVLGNDEDELYARSPIAHLDRLKANVMLIVGGTDRRVPPVQGDALHGELDKRRIAHEWLYERTEGHGFFEQNHIENQLQKLIAFLDRNIGSSSK